MIVTEDIVFSVGLKRKMVGSSQLYEFTDPLFPAMERSISHFARAGRFIIGNEYRVRCSIDGVVSHWGSGLETSEHEYLVIQAKEGARVLRGTHEWIETYPVERFVGEAFGVLNDVRRYPTTESEIHLTPVPNEVLRSMACHAAFVSVVRPENHSITFPCPEPTAPFSCWIQLKLRKRILAEFHRRLTEFSVGNC